MATVGTDTSTGPDLGSKSNGRDKVQPLRGKTKRPKLIAREANVEDIPDLLIMGQKFHNASPWSELNYDYTAVAVMLKNMIASPKACLFIHDGGMLGGLIEPVYFDPSALFAREAFWWAESGGKVLLSAFEDWAEDLGATHVTMVGLQYPDQKKNLKLDKLYGRMGYEPAERHFVRTF